MLRAGSTAGSERKSEGGVSSAERGSSSSAAAMWKSATLVGVGRRRTPRLGRAASAGRFARWFSGAESTRRSAALSTALARATGLARRVCEPVPGLSEGGTARASCDDCRGQRARRGRGAGQPRARPSETSSRARDAISTYPRANGVMRRHPARAAMAPRRLAFSANAPPTTTELHPRPTFQRMCTRYAVIFVSENFHGKYFSHTEKFYSG